MRRLNVQFSQIEECIRTSMFAVGALPRNPPLERGEELLLQLVTADAAPRGLSDRRIQFALVFERSTPDTTGAISREHWPNAAKTWKHILFCSETLPCVPFSLENLNLGKDYAGQVNPAYIEPADAARIRPYIKDGARPEQLLDIGSVDGLLAAIRNYDTVLRLEPQDTVRVREHPRRTTDPWLGDALKTLYNHRCQICLHDFKPRYGVAYADTRFIKPLDAGGLAASRNTLVICPNHNAIISTAKAAFDSRQLAFAFPNGLVEKVTLRDHLLA
jgi:hypothetical protein